MGRRAAGNVAATACAGMTLPALTACAFIAAASVAGTLRGWGAGEAMDGWARASEDKTTAGSAAVVAAMTGMLMVRFGERGVVMKSVLISTAVVGVALL
ncbi:hypothetical protein StoSoilB20_17010 [Arthrobacter sp. StoSoilB20]|nr:hypothetical protein StoSoilB20_17010 [Arthrobacter sp. StoSoilB20]